MNKKALLIINPILFLSLLVQGISGIFMKFGLFYSLMYGIHSITGFIFLGIVTLHIVFNWNWIKANLRKKPKRADQHA
ncbi:DUF4405 domain-containing protein [Sediminispirochaeta bajacaliforniensis]|uniref:DUF4405 domain-containing protein n=1 Tax=Sediminispirochaeta bajacaliforniensis TaxID=148 RepID=UPI000361D769|nr:DUF4405 domain-containing protein [Sediminispirochaeta bajacaliforniensis]